MKYKIYILLLQFIICGFKNAEAIMGQNIRAVRENEYVGVVCIVKHDPELEWKDKLTCTGTFLSNMFVLTAEHCLEDANVVQYEVSMGSRQVENGERYYPIWWMSYDQWSARRNNRVLSSFNDIILMKIFGLPPQISPCVLGNHPNANFLYGLGADVVGCGRINSQEIPSELHTGSVTIVTNQECRRIVSRLQGANVYMSEKYYCSVGVPQTYMDTGDSGGPLMYFGVIVGVNIAVCPILDGRVHNGQVNIHVNLYYYQNFIVELMQADNIN